MTKPELNNDQDVMDQDDEDMIAEDMESDETDAMDEKFTDSSDDDIDDSRIPANDADPLRVLEAILFAAASPLTPNTIRERMPADADVGGLLMQLQSEYADRGVNLVELDGTWAFRTAHDLADVLRVRKEVQRKLSRSAMETLAIIAYHQPVTRAEIENIRGVATNKGTLDILMEVGWVKPGRRRETPGRPLTWVTSSTFLDQFGLASLMDLPGVDELKASGLLDRRPAIENIGGDLFGDNDEDDMAQAEADLEAENETDEDGNPFDPGAPPVASSADSMDDEDEDFIAANIEGEPAYEDEVSDEEWEAAQADDSPVAIEPQDIDADEYEEEDDR